MLPFLGDDFGNAHSLHASGRRAHAAVEDARAQLATALEIEDPSQIVFTSGATESNSWIMRSFPGAWISPFEHESIWGYSQYGAHRLDNCELEILPPPTPVEVVSVMSVNNELGCRFDPLVFREHSKYLHSDITQAAIKLDLSLAGIDFASLSAHKFYGPKGVGALYIKGRAPTPLFLGEQEMGLRGGTLNVAGIVGMGAAAKIGVEEREGEVSRATSFQETLLAELGAMTDMQINGGENRSPYILSLGFAGVEGETLVIELDAAGFAISAGAACSSGSNELSHVLEALNLDEAFLRGTIRISFGRFNTNGAVVQLAHAIRKAVVRLRDTRP